MDIVYALGRGSTWKNNELRYSLRSLSNIKHDRVFIVGECPVWANVIHIPCQDHLTRRQISIFNKIMEAVKDERVSENFIYFADDYYLLKPYSPYYYNNGLLIDRVKEYGGKYRAAMQNSIDAGAVYNYDIHTPFIYNKKGFINKVSSLDWNKEYVIKSVYMGDRRAGYMEDVKVKNNKELEEKKNRGLISSGHVSYEMRMLLKTAFPNKCQYEN